jgi:succinoglycan biosynthesis protein ExoW
MSDSTPRLAVVIPYYQRQAGLLRSAISSVLTQPGQFHVTILVVDDSSPHPPDAELDGAWLESGRVHLVRQSNAGPSAARNRGLDSLPQGTDYVAFLDSDDRWTESFVIDAYAAFKSGADLFFADTSRFSEEKSRFNWTEGDDYRLTAAGHSSIDSGGQVFRFQGDFLDFLIHRSNIMSSAFAYRLDCAPSLRFNRELNYGEDRLFKLSLARRCRWAAFSTRVGCIEGPGVNIFDVSNPGSGRALRLASDYIHLNRILLQTMPLTAAQRTWLRSALGRSRLEWLFNARHALRLRTPELASSLRLTLARDPWLPLAVLRDRLRPRAA